MNSNAERITVFAPATVANVACAFDILGFAICHPGDEVEVVKSEQPGVRLIAITGDDGLLPREPERNTATVAITALVNRLDRPCGFDVWLHKKMPLGSGMGSSAASAAAGVWGANKLLGEPLPPEQLVAFAMEGERIACGSAHADNVAPALLGGFVLIRSYQPLDLIPITPPAELHCALVHPDIHIRTEDARRVLKKHIPLEHATVQWGNAAALIAGLMNSDYELISRSLHDVIIEPERSLLIPGFDAVKTAALDAGALGCSISGAGPSLFALCRSSTIAHEAARAMEHSFTAIGIAAQTYVSPINSAGPAVVSQGES